MANIVANKTIISLYKKFSKPNWIKNNRQDQHLHMFCSFHLGNFIFSYICILVIFYVCLLFEEIHILHFLSKNLKEKAKVPKRRLGIIKNLRHIKIKKQNTLQRKSCNYTAIPYMEVQGKPCNENRDLAMRTGFPCNESRFFPVEIDLQGFPVSFTGFGFAV